MSINLLTPARVDYSTKAPTSQQQQKRSKHKKDKLLRKKESVWDEPYPAVPGEDPEGKDVTDSFCTKQPQPSRLPQSKVFK